ncbi:uncharacterized protein LOC144543507 [Centroberyx gerrardi]
MYTTPAVLPYGFHVSMIINFCLNTAWLFLFDRELLLPALIISALMTFTDYMVLFFSCHGLKVYGAWLNKYHTIDLWLIRILVQNGMAVYATWGTITTLLNLTIYLQYQTTTPRCDCATLSLLLLLMELLAWFLLENFYLDEHVRYIVTIYPVVILWLTGTLTNSASPASHMYIFAAFILGVACIMFVIRITLVIWRHRKRPLYSDSGLWSDTMAGSRMPLRSVESSNHVAIHGVSIALAVIAQVCSEIFRYLATDPNVPNVLSFCMLYMSYCNLNKHRSWLLINNPSETWWIRYLTQNGLALFAWWALLEAVVCFGIVLKYKAGLQDPAVSTAVLTVIFFFMLTW